MKTKIDYTGTSDVITEAVQKANNILNNDFFHSKLSEKQSFDESNANGKIISDLIKNSNIFIQNYLRNNHLMNRMRMVKLSVI